MTVVPPVQINNGGASLKDLLLDPTDQQGISTVVNWSAVACRLRTHAHEAAAYERGCVSPLQYALSKRTVPPPAAVVRQILACHPRAAEDRDGDGSSALYYACYYDQSHEVVKILLEFNGAAACQVNAYGILPLHVARTASVARLLLSAHPEGLHVRSNWSSLPLHYAASMADTEPDVVRLFVEEGCTMGIGGQCGGGGLFSKGSSGKLPHERVSERIAASAVQSKQDKDGGSTHDGNDCRRYCEKLVILIEMMLAEPHEFSRPYRFRKGGNILHAMVELGCPSVSISYALKKNPVLATSRNDMGQLPLAIAASMHNSKEVIRILLDSSLGLDRTAAYADSAGRLPLHTAAETGIGFEDGISDLLRAEPRALESRNTKDGMFPFMLAASSKYGTINCVYNLIRSAPCIATPLPN